MSSQTKQIAPDVDNFSWYLAGLIDGEGSFIIYVVKNKKNFSPVIRIKITSTNQDALFKIKAVLGIGNVYPYNSKANSGLPAYGWYASSFQDVKTIIDLIDGKLIIKFSELEKIKKVIEIIDKKRLERGIRKQGFTKDQLVQILEIRDSLRMPSQRGKGYHNKEYFLQQM
ncbi:MAG TPA: LAGLIDADG family homing endonuclease [archaeon]|nr:LAGLIDADG family homing endonuclease [archaeon]